MHTHSEMQMVATSDSCLCGRAETVPAPAPTRAFTECLGPPRPDSSRRGASWPVSERVDMFQIFPFLIQFCCDCRADPTNSHSRETHLTSSISVKSTCGQEPRFCPHWTEHSADGRVPGPGERSPAHHALAAPTSALPAPQTLALRRAAVPRSRVPQRAHQCHPAPVLCFRAFKPRPWASCSQDAVHRATASSIAPPCSDSEGPLCVGSRANREAVAGQIG